MGRHISPGDVFETFRPGYQVINGRQAEPRFLLSIAAVNLDADGHSATITTGRRVEDLRLVVRMTRAVAPTTATGAVAQLPITEFPADLGGVSATWTLSTDGERWSGWPPHPDLTVVRTLTRGSAPHARLWELFERRGTLQLGGQLDLSRMLQPSSARTTVTAEPANIFVYSGKTGVLNGVAYSLRVDIQ